MDFLIKALEAARQAPYDRITYQECVSSIRARIGTNGNDLELKVLLASTYLEMAKGELDAFDAHSKKGGHLPAIQALALHKQYVTETGIAVGQAFSNAGFVSAGDNLERYLRLMHGTFSVYERNPQ